MEKLMIIIPRFGTFRMVSDAQNILISANDAAAMLGFKSPRDAVSRYCCPAGCSFIPFEDSIGRMQRMKFITPKNLYSLCRKSPCDDASEFAEWFSAELAPVVRFLTYQEFLDSGEKQVQKHEPVQKICIPATDAEIVEFIVMAPDEE